jgi:hypothetical protein
MIPDDQIIIQTKNWITKVVVGLNFCPFAAREIKLDSIHYKVFRSENLSDLLETLALEINRLDANADIETTLIILPDLFPDFQDYLDMIERCENYLKASKKEGIYQIASFHPEYLFAGSAKDDPANYTNRSLYPMIHLLREASITRALSGFQTPESIPFRNIEFSRSKGIEYMLQLRDSCFNVKQD